MAFGRMGDGPRNRQLVNDLSVMIFDPALIHDDREDFARFAADGLKQFANDHRRRLGGLQFGRRRSPMQTAASAPDVKLDGAGCRQYQDSDREVSVAIAGRWRAGFIDVGEVHILPGQSNN